MDEITKYLVVRCLSSFWHVLFINGQQGGSQNNMALPKGMKMRLLWISPYLAMRLCSLVELCIHFRHLELLLNWFYLNLRSNNNCIMLELNWKSKMRTFLLAFLIHFFPATIWLVYWKGRLTVSMSGSLQFLFRVYSISVASFFPVLSQWDESIFSTQARRIMERGLFN